LVLMLSVVFSQL